MRERRVQLDTDDGQRLAGTWTAPERPRAVLLIAPATATPHRYYTRFARYAAEQGYATLAFDYRGIGESRPASLRGFPATMRDWAERDLDAALRLACDRADGRPVLVLAHSFGGQALALLPAPERLTGVVTVGAQLGWYGHWPRPHRWRIALVMRALVPAAVGAFGYWPGRIGLGEDMPGGAATEWARWCRSPGYLLDHVPGAAERLRSFPAPVHLIGTTDDTFAPIAAVEALHACFGRATLELWDPRDHGFDRIDHFGFFRAARSRLWPLLIARLDAFLPTAERPVARGC